MTWTANVRYADRTGTIREEEYVGPERYLVMASVYAGTRRGEQVVSWRIANDAPAAPATAEGGEQ